MRVLFIHPNYHSGGAEIAGNWPPAWVAYLTGPLKKAGYTDVHFCDAMTNKLTDEQVRSEIARVRPDIIGMTAITPSIYKAENLLKIARETVPNAVLVLGGIHATFMYAQVLTEAPWIDVIVRGEGEEIFLNLVQTIDRGQWPANRASLEGLAYREVNADGARIVATKAAATVKDLDSINPDWSILEWSKYTYIPMGKRVAIPNMARGCPFTCSFCSQWKFWRDYRIRDPKKVVDEIETLVRDHDVGFFILADEEPTINKKKFVRFCEELIARDLNIPWGINTRVTDILRDEKELALYRKAGLIHVSLGTEAAAQLKLDRFNKETTIEQNKKAIRLLREAGIVVEAQFIVGLENETKETLEETYRMAEDWQPDLANWAMYTPWPFSDLFQDLDNKVEVFDFDKYNFVTPIIKPDAMDRGELLDGVMKNYRRFYMKKALFSYPWAGTGERRKYLLGCLKAFMMAGFKRQFYDLGRVKYWGPQSKGQVDFGFAPNHTGSTARPIAPTPGDWPTAADATRKRAGMKQISPATVAHTDAAKAAVLCGGGTEQMTEEEMDGFVIDHSPEDDAYSVPVAPGLQRFPNKAKEPHPAD